MSERHRIAGELFHLPPADLYRLPKRPSVPSGTALVLDLVTEPSDSGSGGEGEGEGESEEVHTHGDALSTATTGSNPIPFFSDQVNVCPLLVHVIMCVHVCIHLYSETLSANLNLHSRQVLLTKSCEMHITNTWFEQKRGL